MAALPPAAGRLERGGAHRAHHLAVAARLHGDDRVAGVDRALEARRALDGHDVAHLRRAEQAGDARHQVLAEGGGGPEHVAVGARRPRPPAARAPRPARARWPDCRWRCTRVTPPSCAASAATAAESAAHTTMAICAPASARAQLTQRAVLGLSLRPSCSATMRTLALTGCLSSSGRRPARRRP